MSRRFRSSKAVTDLPTRQAIGRERQRGITFLILALFAGGTGICTALIAPILWTAVTDVVQQSRSTYPRCGTVKDIAGRQACHDRVLRDATAGKALAE
jgi:hypothetical protein